MSDYSNLKRLAEAAPEGPWFGPEYAPKTGYVFDNCLGSLLHYESIEYEQESCLLYVAAANPAAVLQLIAENEKLLARDAEHIRQFNELSEFRHRNIEVFDKKISVLEAENEALRSELGASPDLFPNVLRIKRSSPEYAEAWNKWSEEQIALRKDAERYRWLREVGGKTWTNLDIQAPAKLEWYDCCVDEAMSHG